MPEERAIFGRLLFLGFLIVPIIEIGLFITLGQIIGLWPTLLGVVVTAVIGSAIIRSQGLSLLNDFRANAARGTLPGRQIAEGMMLAVAGAFLLTPGYFTDTLGFLLLVPPVRFALYEMLKSRIQIVTTSTVHPSQAPHDPDVIDLGDDHWRRH